MNFSSEKEFCINCNGGYSNGGYNSYFVGTPYSLGEGLARTLKYEFLHPQPDNITFVSE
ncbi:MAG: hypothetical protein LBL94_05570 [Prevotellaceae bacterium]|nr:hypothetical protein [Prevotellaceae bacterium]